VLGICITLEEVREVVRGLVWSIGNLHDVLLAGWAEPALVVLPEHFSRLRRAEELPPLVQDLLEMCVDLGIQESGVTARCTHWVVENGTHGHTDHTNVCCCISPVRCCGEGVVENFKHVVIVTDLLEASGVLVVGLLHGHLVEHGVEVHVDARGRLNELFEVLENGSQLLLVSGRMLDLTT
jgi:hypothetical protein